MANFSYLWLHALRAELFASEPAVMTLDVRGRMVANKDAVFRNEQIMEEIEAAKILSKALARLRSNQVAARSAPSGEQG